MIDVVKARQLLQITEAGWQLLTDEEWLQIIKIFHYAADREEKNAAE